MTLSTRAWLIFFKTTAPQVFVLQQNLPFKILVWFQRILPLPVFNALFGANVNPRKRLLDTHAHDMSNAKKTPFHVFAHAGVHCQGQN